MSTENLGYVFKLEVKRIKDGKKTMLRGTASGHNEILQYLQKMEKRLERRIEDKFQSLLYMPPEMRPYNQAKQHFEATAAATSAKPASSPESLENDL